MAVQDIFVPVQLEGGAVIVVRATQTDPERPVASQAFDLSGLIGSMRAMLHEVVNSLSSLELDKVAIELGFDFAIESGKLVALLADGSAKSSLKVNVEWTRPRE